MLEFVGNLVSNGWNAVSNITSGIGKGASSLVSSFFPAAQKTTTISATTLARENQGSTYRSTLTQAASLADKWLTEEPASAQSLAQPTSFWSRLWSGLKTTAAYTPTGLIYKAVTSSQVATPAAPVTAQKVASVAASEKVSTFDKMLQDVYGFAETTVGKVAKVTTLGDQLLALGQKFGLVKPREVTVETPRAGSPEGTDVQHLNQLQAAGASVLESIQSVGGQMLSQLKGLFSLGYSGPEGAQPVFTIAHEIEPSTKTTTGLIIASVILVVLFLIFRGRK